MKAILASSTLVLLLAVGAAAEPQGEKKQGKDKGFRNGEFANQFFARLDQNEDGAVDQNEFAANPRLDRATPEQQKTLFTRLDKDSDGFIRRDELKPPKGMGRMASGERPNWLQKGPVSFDQFSQQPRVQRLSEDMRQKLFDRLDQNDDGILSEADIKQGKGQRPERRSKGPPPHTNLDTDQDGKVSFAEFQTAPFHRGLSEDEAEDRFEALDKDSDGLLSPEERPKNPARKKGTPKKKSE